MAFIKPSGYSDFSERTMASSEVGTSPPALALVKQAGLLPVPPAHVKLFDNACGQGNVTKQLLDHVSEVDRGNIEEVVCGELDLTMVDLTKKRIDNLKWPSLVRAEHLDSHSTNLPDEHFTHVLMNFGPQLMKDPIKMIAESRRILVPGGVFGFTTWVRPGFIPSMKAVFPDRTSPTPVSSIEWHNGSSIQKCLEDSGFTNVKIEPVEFETEDMDVEGYLELFTGILMGTFFNKMGEEAKQRYSEYMRQPGKMKMQWLAFAVTANKN